MTIRLHAFDANDALGFDDATALHQRLRRGEVSPAEVQAAALARLAKVEPVLAGLATPERPGPTAPKAEAPLAHVPTLVKDNTDLAGLPTRYGSAAVPARPAARDGAFARSLRAAGLVPLGKSALPEFGFNASTEPAHAAPTRNPWHTGHSAGGSSGGSAALVASGVVPIAHANDGGGSIRIPAACCGLVGLKPTRGRLVDGEMARRLPFNIVCEGVVTRSVRDTAAFFAAAEAVAPARGLPPIGQVEGPGRERLRVGLVERALSGAAIAPAVSEAVARTARLLEAQGHCVEPIAPPADPGFVSDFVHYWGFLAFLTATTGRLNFGRGFDPARLDDLSKGLARHFRRRFWQLPGVLRRLRQTHEAAQTLTRRYDVVLSPVLAHPAPALGQLDPRQPFEILLERLLNYVAFTPLNNANGTPAIALPAGLSPEGLPLSVQLSAGHGQERRLIELAYLLEQAQPFPTLARA